MGWVLLSLMSDCESERMREREGKGRGTAHSSLQHSTANH